MSKEGEWIFSRGGGEFSESNFQLLIKYHIRYKNVNDSNNHNHNVLYLLKIFKCLQLCKLKTFQNKKFHMHYINSIRFSEELSFRKAKVYCY